MVRRLLTTVGVTLTLVSPVAAHAGAPFSSAVSDDVLADVRGTASPYASLSRATLVRLADEQSRSAFRVEGTVARIQMDVWWGTIGSELIANAVRSGS